MRTTLGILCLVVISMLVIAAVPLRSAQVDPMAVLERRVSDLEVDRKLMMSDINQLKLDREYDSDSIQGVSDSVDDLRDDLNKGTVKIDKLRADLDELSKRVSDLQGKVGK
jgi:hypothetical protein